jgi:hypothetical protein
LSVSRDIKFVFPKGSHAASEFGIQGVAQAIAHHAHLRADDSR